MRSLLVANRGEIAVRVLRAAAELKIRTIAIYTAEDRFALHRFKADESYQIGSGGNPLGDYLNIEAILDIGRRNRVDAVHPGYGFLSENPDFADACADAGITFIGPPSSVMRQLGNKIEARQLAERAGIPVMPASSALPNDLDQVTAIAERLGYPLMLKASWGGGGRGMRTVHGPDDLRSGFAAARREALSAFGNDQVYFEKLIERARHVEVQILGDQFGNLVHLYERDCSMQRRHQKVVERAPAPYLSDMERSRVCDSAVRLAREAGYINAGTVEFLQDVETGLLYFIEVNPRIQVEHTVTEEITGIDLVKAQISVARGERIGEHPHLPPQESIAKHGHALQCRLTTEDPEHNFVPDYGRIATYRSASGFGIRLDGGTAYAGARITPYYDSLLVKITAWALTPDDAISRMDRALREFRIRGVSTNLAFLENLINHESFLKADYTTTFIDNTPALFRFKKKRDRASRLLRFIGDVIVNGNSEIRGRNPVSEPVVIEIPITRSLKVPDGHRQRLLADGPEKFARWMRGEPRVLITDTTMRDAHQSLLATRVRTIDMLKIAPFYAQELPQLFSLECWGGATFDVAMRYLHEDPWERLQQLREVIPNIPLQMLLRGSNAVGYTNYPDNVVQNFVAQAADNGIDVFRVFDSLNWIDNMRIALDAVLEAGALCEGTICYSGDMLAKGAVKYDLDYYLTMARALAKAGVHVIGIKDMAGVCKPHAARLLVQAIREETGLPLHFHTHDTSGVAAATVLAAIEAGADAVDGAIDSMSGLTSQPNLNSINEIVSDTERNTGLNRKALRTVSHYWQSVRQAYSAFESDIRAGTADIYRHAMPGGQYTNLREQARGLGIEHRWPEIAEAYSQVNEMFGDIIKVTPTSKVVGDMALYMVTSGLTVDDVVNPDHEVDFPESVVSLLRGDLGQPAGGFPSDLQRKVLKGEKPSTTRPGATLAPINLEAVRTDAAALLRRRISDTELSSYTLYPKVFEDYARHRQEFGDVSVLPTSVFFYGMRESDEIEVEIERGKTLLVRFIATSDPDEQGQRRVFFELNGQPRSVFVSDRSLAATSHKRAKAEEGNQTHLGSPMPGAVTNVYVSAGDKVKPGDAMFTIEAMKMETVLRADRAATISDVLVESGSAVHAQDLLAIFT